MYSFFKLDLELKMWMFTVGCVRADGWYHFICAPRAVGQHYPPIDSTFKPKTSTFQSHLSAVFTFPLYDSLLHFMCLCLKKILWSIFFFFYNSHYRSWFHLFSIMVSKLRCTHLPNIIFFIKSVFIAHIFFVFGLFFPISVSLSSSAWSFWSWYYSHIPDCLCSHRCSPFSSAMLRHNFNYPEGFKGFLPLCTLEKKYLFNRKTVLAAGLEGGRKWMCCECDSDLMWVNPGWEGLQKNKQKKPLLYSVLCWGDFLVTCMSQMSKWLRFLLFLFLSPLICLSAN